MNTLSKKDVIRELGSDETEVVSGGSLPLLSGVQSLLDVGANVGLNVGDIAIGLGTANGENGLSFGIGFGPIKL
ncbi:hypothetical protein ACWKX9_25995 [Enterobacter asburiae]